MTDKPKISHFDNTSPSKSRSFKDRYSDRSKLAELYPKPKTNEQRIFDDTLRQKSYRRRWPKHPSLTIAIYGSVLFMFIVFFLQSLNSWWFSNPGNNGATMSVVFFTFTLGLGLIFLIFAWVKFVNIQFSYFGGLLKLFWFIYYAFFAGIITFWLSGLIGDYTSILWLPSLAVIHFIIVFIIAIRILGRVLSVK